MNTNATVVETDVLVVGARVAGAATALLLARAGHDVIAVDRATLPSPTLSTHGLSPGGVVLLGRWGLLDRVLDTGTPAIDRITVGTPRGTVVVPVRPRHGAEVLVAPRREVLDGLLVDAAAASGARIQAGVAIQELVVDRTGRVVGARGRRADGSALTYRARFVVGADGLRSRVAKAVAAPFTRAIPSDSVTAYAYFEGVEHEGIEIHLADGSATGLFPTHGGTVLWRGSRAASAVGLDGSADDRVESFLAGMAETAPGLAERARAGRRTSPVRGTRDLPNQLRHPVGPGWALAGDAGHHRDPITGHGITDAFRDAELLAGALDDVLLGAPEAEAMAHYHRERDARIEDIFGLTVQLSRYPTADEAFRVERDLGAALEREADWLAARPLPPVRRRAPAAAL
jgi:2-polyprenyl-6-methoxyphenol hydroxylase-like FAD-dependent oxidoreductase